MHADEIQSALPDPDGREPLSLRHDIVDELSDHLRCAVRRELRHQAASPDDPTSQRKAWRAAIDHFGNPRAVARKLYFDAMKETIMKDRILLTAVAVLTIVCLASVALSWFAMSQSREVNAKVIASLETLTSNATSRSDNMDWNEVVVTVREGSETGPPPDNAYKVELNGYAINYGEKSRLKATVDAQGVAKFGPIRPGDYVITVWGRHWQQWQDRISVIPGEPHKLTIVAPAEKPDLVTVTPVIQWPEGGGLEDVYVHLNVGYKPRRGAVRTWRQVVKLSAFFGQDGEPITVGQVSRSEDTMRLVEFNEHSIVRGAWKLLPEKHRVSIEVVRRIRDSKGEWTNEFKKLKDIPPIDLDLTGDARSVELPIEVPSDLSP